jgi:hypothetical protein
MRHSTSPREQPFAFTAQPVRTWPVPQPGPRPEATYPSRGILVALILSSAFWLLAALAI